MAVRIVSIHFGGHSLALNLQMLLVAPHHDGADAVDLANGQRFDLLAHFYRLRLDQIGVSRGVVRFDSTLSNQLAERWIVRATGR